MSRQRTSTRRAPSRLESFRRDVARCVRCGSCRAVCPSFAATLDESFSARGRMALVQSILDGKTAVSSAYEDRLSSCTGCLACETDCPSGVPVTRIVQAAREAAVQEKGTGLIRRVVSASLASSALMSSLAWIAPVVLHYAGGSMRGGRRGAGMRTAECGLRNGRPGTRGGPERRGMQENKGRIAFFPGCAVAYFQRDIEQAFISVMNALGWDVVVPEGLQCCGRPHLGLGDRAAAEARACANTDLLGSLDVAAVATACASCGLTFKSEYPTLLGPSGRVPVPVLDVHELLARAGTIAGLASQPMRVTWHDPCHLGRGQGLSRAARNALLSVPGVELVEMRQPDRCCGFGGVMRIRHHGLSDRVGGAKAEDIISTGAGMVVTGCPGCRMQLSESLRRAGSDAVVVHTLQVLEAALPIAERGAMITLHGADTVGSRRP